MIAYFLNIQYFGCVLIKKIHQVIKNVWKCESETIYQESGLEISKLIFQYLIITKPIETEKYTQKLVV